MHAKAHLTDLWVLPREKLYFNIFKSKFKKSCHLHLNTQTLLSIVLVPIPIIIFILILCFPKVVPAPSISYPSRWKEFDLSSSSQTLQSKAPFEIESCKSKHAMKCPARWNGVFLKQVKERVHTIQSRKWLLSAEWSSPFPAQLSRQYPTQHRPGLAPTSQPYENHLIRSFKNYPCYINS